MWRQKYISDPTGTTSIEAAAIFIAAGYSELQILEIIQAISV
jgi:hypothetical protein